MIHVGDCREMLRDLPSGSVQTCVTSPPYFGLRDYGVSGQIGLESSLDAYVAELVTVFREVRRVLHDTGTLWLNLGDSYHTDSPIRTKSAEAFSETWDKSQTASRGGLRKSAAKSGVFKNKDLLGVPWRVAFALQADGWYLRSDIIWHKPNPMPESVRDRPTKAHEYLFLLTNSPRYFYDADAIREPAQSADRPQPTPDMKRVSPNGNTPWLDNRYAPGASGYGVNPSGRNKRTVWTITPKPFKGAHFAVMPPALVEPCILAGSRPGDLVLDPFAGAGTVGVVALSHGRRFVGVELNPDYAQMATERIARSVPHVLQPALPLEGAAD